MRVETKNLAELYGLEPLEWERAIRQSEDTTERRTCWLATMDRDGRPHVTGVGALWVDGKVYFTSGPGTRKSRNIATNPKCALAVGLGDMNLVIEGTASKVTDEAIVRDLADRYADQGRPAHAEGTVITAEYRAPAAGSAPWDLYVIEPRDAIGTATAEPQGATRWDFMPDARPRR